MYLYFKKEGIAPRRVHAEGELPAALQAEGYEAASFAEWWGSMSPEEQAHQRALLAEGSPEALDDTEQNFLAEMEAEASEPASEEAPSEEAAPEAEPAEAPAEEVPPSDDAPEEMAEEAPAEAEAPVEEEPAPSGEGLEPAA